MGAVVLTGARPDRFIAHYDVASCWPGAQRSGVSRRVAHASLRVAGALRRVPATSRPSSGRLLAGLLPLERFHAIFLSMSRSGAVYVAALNGSAMGGGCELALRATSA